MRITVLPHRHIPSPEADDFDQRDADAQPATLADALAATWGTDAHFAAYEPLCPPELDGAAVRLASGAFAEGLSARMVALVGDLDDPAAHREKRPASKEWRDTVEPVLHLSGLAHYATRGGYRVLAELAEPADLRSAEDARAWRATYLGWCESLKAKWGLDLDQACADWTRLYRLPNVVRDGVEQRAPVVGALPVVDAFAIPAKAVTDAAPVVGVDDRDLTDRERAELDAAAELLAPEFELGKRNSIALAIGGWLRSVGLPPSSAEYLVAQLPSEEPAKRVADAVKAWSKPGPVEGWAALRRFVGSEALAAVQAIQVGPSARKGLLERMAARRERGPAPTAAANADPFAALGRRLDLSRDPEPLNWLCEPLGIAPGKITTIAGYAGTGKGPLLNYFVIAVAAGLPFLRMPVRRARVLLWDCETGPMLRERLHRIANALGVDLVALERDGWLTVIEGVPPLTDEHVAAIRVLATDKRVELLAIDSYTSAFLGLDQNSSEFSGPAFVLGSLSSETGCSVLITTHDRKSTSSKGAGSDFENQSGHNSLQAAQQASVRLVRPDSESTVVELRCGRHPRKGFAPICIRWEDVEKPEAGGGKYGKLSAAEWGLRATPVERPAVDDAPDHEAEEIDRRILKYLLSQPCPIAMRSIQKNVRGKGETYIKDRLLSLVERALVVQHSHANAGNGRTHETFECGRLTAEQRLKISG